MYPRTKNQKFSSLISMVQKNRVLYDYRMEKYHDEEYKNKIWGQVAASCGYNNVAEAKHSWYILCKFFMINYFNELIRLARTYYSAEAVKLPKLKNTGVKGTWCYYSEMSFIAPYRSKDNPELERLVQLAKPIVLRKSQQLKPEPINKIAIKNISASAETQTPPENVHMDIPPINDENLSEKEMCLRSFFDAMFRATNTLPAQLQSKIKRDLLKSVTDAETKAEAERMNDTSPKSLSSVIRE